MTNKDRHDANGEKGERKAIASDSGKRSRAGARGLDARSLEAIGRSLKAHYDELVRAPVPDKFLELLDRLEANEGTPNSQGSGSA